MGVVSCPHCGLAVQESPELAGVTVNCPNCRRPFQMPVPQAVAVSTPSFQPAVEDFRPQYSTTAYRRERGPQNSPGVAAVLSFFFVGLGQIYNGEIGKGLLMMVGYIVCLVITAFTVGLAFPLPLLLWVWGMIDAYNEAERFNRRRR